MPLDHNHQKVARKPKQLGGWRILTLVYCKKIDTMVPLVRASLQTPPRMQGSWSNNDVETPKVVVESSRGVTTSQVQTSKAPHNTTTNEAIDINDIS